MDKNEEIYIEGMAFTGSLTDTAARLVNDYPDLPEEVMNFIKLLADVLKLAETNLFDTPRFETAAKSLIDEL